MNAPIAAMIFVSAVAASLAIAIAFEWLCLRGVMALMPVRQAHQQSATPGITSQARLARGFARGQKH